MEVAELDIKVNTQGITDADTKLKKLGNTASWLEGTLKKAFAAISIYKIIELATGAATAAARFETLGVVLNTVGNNAGRTAAEMAEYEKALTKSGIANTEARETLIRMTQAHIDLTKSQQLARVAQDAAVVGNMNSSEAFQRMIYGIQSGQTEILRTIGLNVNFEKSYRDLAQQLGKNVKDLTETEKIQARTNVVMEKGKDIAGAYEGAMGTVGKQMTSLKRVLDNLELKFGEVFKPVLGATIKLIYEAVAKLEEWLNKSWDTLSKLGSAVGDLIREIGGLIIELLSLDTGLETTDLKLTFVLRTIQGIGGIVAVLSDTLRGLKVIFLEVAEFGARMWQSQIRTMLNFVEAVPDWMLPGNKAEQSAPLRLGLVNMEIAARYAGDLADKTSMGELATERWLENLEEVSKVNPWKDKINKDKPTTTTTTSTDDKAAKKAAKKAADELRQYLQEMYDLEYEAREINRKVATDAYLQQEEDAKKAGEFAKAYWEERNAYELQQAQKHADDMRNVNTTLFGELGQTLQGWAQASTNTLVEFATGGKASFSDLISSMIKELMRLYVYKNIMAPLFGLGDDSGTSGIAGFFNSMFGRAVGGPVKAGVPYRVGERGEEAFVPSTDGRIIPNNQLGGVTNTTYITVQVGDDGANVKGTGSRGEDIGRSLKPYMDAWALEEMRYGGVLNPAT